MKRTIFVLALLTLASGCGSDGLSTDDGMCVRGHQSCVVGGERCCTGFCASSGYYAYGSGAGKGTCSAFLPDGSYCTNAAECESNVCSEYQCVASAASCGALHDACTKSADCCAGFCDDQGYSINYHTCIVAQPDGSYCTENPGCQSNICQNHQCVATACIDKGKCAASTDCCSGYCQIGYVTGFCAAPQTNGAYCLAASECQSGHCSDYACVE